MFCGYESFHSLVRRNPKFDLRPNAFIIRLHALLKFRRAISAEPSRECGAVQPCRRFPFRILVVRRTRIMHFHKFFTTIKINHFFGLTKPSQFLGNAVNQNSSRANGLNRIDTFFFKSFSVNKCFWKILINCTCLFIFSSPLQAAPGRLAPPPDDTCA